MEAQEYIFKRYLAVLADHLIGIKMSKIITTKVRQDKKIANKL